MSANDINIASTFSLDAGVIDMGANRITLGSGTGSLGSLSHIAPARIVGEFERWVNVGNQTGLELPIGTTTDLAEAILDINTLSSPGSIIVQFISSDPGDNGLTLDDNGTDIFNSFFEALKFML